MEFFRAVIHSGLPHAESVCERRNVLLANLISVTIFLASLLLFLAYFHWYGLGVLTFYIPLVGVVGLLALLLNRFNQSVAGRTLLCLLIPVAALSLSVYSKKIYYSEQTSLDYFSFRFPMLAACILPVTLFSFRERRFMITNAIVSFAILMCFDTVHELFKVGYRASDLQQGNYTFVNIVLLISFIVMAGAVGFLKSISDGNEARVAAAMKELEVINLRLQEKNSEAEYQNREIRKQATSLNQKQEQLKEAYTLIENQRNLLQIQNKNLSNELVSANKELSEANQELIKHNNELRQFSYTVSHNLRGPVASLSGLVHLIQPESLDLENKEIFAHVKDSVERLESIIKDLTKIIDIRHEIFNVRQRINLREEIASIKNIFQTEITQNNIKFEIDTSRCEAIYSVRPMVQSILYNLITNAIKYRASDRPAVIRIRAEEGEHYAIEITDNGLGIDLRNHRENLFKLYKRFHYHTEGKGLGLYLVKLQTEALNGSIEVTSEVNRFTTFRITLGKPNNLTRQTLYRERHAEIFYDAILNCTGVIWEGPVTSRAYRSVFEKCLELVKVYGAPNYIADLTKQGPIEHEDQLWMFYTILPEAARHGLKRIAAIKSANPKPEVQQYYTGIEENLSKLGIHQRFFSSSEAAAEWLQYENKKAALVNFA